MRGGPILVALTAIAIGCGPAHRPAAPHASADTARPVSIGGRAAARGSLHAHAWFRFEVQRACSSVTVEASSKPNGIDLGLAVVGPDGVRQTREGNDSVAIVVNKATLGHYHVELVGDDDPAGHYALRVRDTTSGFECGDLPYDAPIMSPRAPATEIPAAPDGFLVVPIRGWGSSRDPASEYRIAVLGKGYAEGVERTGTARLVDPRGTSLGEGSLEDFGFDRNTIAVVAKGGPSVDAAVAVLVPILPHKTPPLQAHVIDRWREGDAVFLSVDTGGVDGAAVGWRGAIESAAGTPIAHVDVVEVGARRSRVRVSDSIALAAVLEARTVQLTPPM